MSELSPLSGEERKWTLGLTGQRIRTGSQSGNGSLEMNQV
jgi:hypothetical protein